MVNLSKSIFISALNLIAVYIFIDSSFKLLTDNFSFLQLGKLISSGSIVFYFAGLFLFARPRTSLNLKPYTILIIMGLLCSSIAAFMYDEHISKSIIIAFLLLVWLIYVYWYSKLTSDESTILTLDEKLPIFELEDINGNHIVSSSFKGQPTIFLFYRGNWCPLCMAQIKEIASQYKELSNRGVKTVLISPQPHKFTKTLAKKHQVSFEFLVDSNGKAAKQLGIYHKNGIPAGFQLLGYNSDTVLPTVIITDKNLRIIYLDQTDNYRIRPEPEEFLTIIDTHLK